MQSHGAYQCPICAPSRRFVTENGLRAHITEKHPWRALPPANRQIPPNAGLLMPQHRHNDNAEFGVGMRRPRATNSDSHSMLSDDVFADNDSGRSDRGESIISMHSDSFTYKPFMGSRGAQRPKPAHSVPDLTFPSDVIDSRVKKRRDRVTSRRPWYDEPGYSGPRTLMETSHFFDFDEANYKEDDKYSRSPARPGIRRMEIELEDRDERINALMEQMEKLMEERRLLQEESLLQGQVSMEHSDEIRALKERLRRKDKEIGTKQKEMARLTDFLSQAAQQELTSRTKLEEFMQDLHNRASKAELEARHLREALHENTSPSNRKKKSSYYPTIVWPDNDSQRGNHSINRWKYYSDSGVDSNNSREGISPLARELQHRLMELKQRKASSDSMSVGSDDNLSYGSVFSEPQNYLRPEPLPSYWSSNGLQANETDRRADALFCIFMYLDTASLFKVGRVNREWYHVSRQPALWRSLRFANGKITEKTLVSICKWCTELRSLSLEMLQDSNRSRSSSSTARSGGHHEVSSRKSNLEDGLERLLKINSKTLTSLKIIDCGQLLGEGAVWKASTLCPKLERLVYLTDYEPVGPELIWALGKGCPNISELVIPPIWPNQQPKKLNNECCVKIGQCFPRIQVVCVGGKEITEKGLLILCESCIRLRHLEVDHGVEVSEALAIKMTQAGLRGLEFLDFTFTPVSLKAIIQFNSACPKLKRITLHAGFSDFFHDPESADFKKRFQAIGEQFKSLIQQPAFKDILEVKLDYG